MAHMKEASQKEKPLLAPLSKHRSLKEADKDYEGLGFRVWGLGFIVLLY